MAANATKRKTAAGTKRPASSRSGSKSSKSSKSSKKKTAKTQTNPTVLYETILLLVLALCIFMFISFFGIGGYLGALVSDFCFGVFGLFAYLFPPLLFLAVAFWISNYKNSLAGFRFGGFVLLYLSLCCFAALVEGEYGGAYSVGKLYARCASFKQGGGVIGGTVCHFAVPAIGQIGTGVVLVIFVLIALVLITQRSLLHGIIRQGDRIFAHVKSSAAKFREERKNRAKEEEWDLPAGEEEDEKESRKGKPAGEEAPNEPDFEDFSVLPKAEHLPVTHRSAGKMEHQDVRTKEQQSERVSASSRPLDVSMLYMPKSSGVKKDRVLANGVTTDTEISGDRSQVASQMHQILPVPEASSSYQEMQEEIPLHINGIDEMQEEVSLHIDGIDEMEEEAPEVFAGEREAPEPLQDSPDLPEAEDAAVEPEESAQTSAPGGRTRHNPRSSEQQIEEGIASVEAEAEQAAMAVRPEYVFPPLTLLHKGSGSKKKGQEAEIRQTAAKLQQTLESFGVHVTVTNVSCGPSVTRYELLPEQGVKVSKIVSLSDDIKLNLAAADIRIEAPIPGKSAVGIEVPNSENSTVNLRDLLESDEFVNHKSKLAFATGKDIGGKIVVSDIAKMPHLLIAGATGSGKSVCINTLIMSILYKATPDEVKLIMIDPKVVELSVYNGIPHLMIPVVTDPKKAAGALNWAVAEMTDRYAKFAEVGARDLKGYNQKVENSKAAEGEPKPEKLPQIVIIVDELADLMMVAPGEVEDSICRLAQLARAAGIHLVIATQRPSVNVITGLIKANMPSRIAFAVTSGVDSRTIIDMYGAEKLLGKGDMLFYPQGYQKPARVQGAFVSDDEVSAVVDFLKEKNTNAAYDRDMEEQIAKVRQAASSDKTSEDTDELFAEAGRFIIEKDKASIGMLQRVFKIGFNRAARIMDQLADAGVVGQEEGTKPRKILMSGEQFDNYLENN